jgi:DNA-binding transcriptional ArsR family regulator
MPEMTIENHEAPKAGRASGGPSAVFHALASDQRMEIVRFLASNTPEQGKTCCAPDELCACKLAEHLGLAPSTISHHMTVLVEAGLVTARPDGKWVHYTLRRDALRAASRMLADL